MAVKIRLKRMGAKKHPFYRVVVADSRSPRDGKFIEEIGWVDPLKDPAEIKIDVESARKWLGNGAQPTDTARAILKKAGVYDAPETEDEAADSPDVLDLPGANEPAEDVVQPVTDETPSSEDQADAGEEPGDSENTDSEQISAETVFDDPAQDASDSDDKE